MKSNDKRNISGILLLDKPLGITSNGALQTVKRLFKASKAGHTGSLDPRASGMLPICFGEATKFSQFLLNANKKYSVVGKLGEVTTTGDSEGEVVEKRVVENIDVGSFEKILPKFRGKISQMPPMYSAIKHKGQPLYKLARQGIEVERSLREINIHELKLLGFDDNLAKFEIYCSKGTYVRTLIVDIGEILGCGAHVSELRRLFVDPYLEVKMVSIDAIQKLSDQSSYKELDELLLPIESMFVDMPEVTLTGSMIYYMATGQTISPKVKVKDTGLIKIRGKDGRFVGIGEVMPEDKIAPRRMIKDI